MTIPWEEFFRCLRGISVFGVPRPCSSAGISQIYGTCPLLLIGFRKGGLLEEVSFDKGLFSEKSRDSREPTDCGKQRRIRPFLTHFSLPDTVVSKLITDRHFRCGELLFSIADTESRCQKNDFPLQRQICGNFSRKSLITAKDYIGLKMNYPNHLFLFLGGDFFVLFVLQVQGIPCCVDRFPSFPGILERFGGEKNSLLLWWFSLLLQPKKARKRRSGQFCSRFGYNGMKTLRVHPRVTSIGSLPPKPLENPADPRRDPAESSQRTPPWKAL